MAVDRYIVRALWYLANRISLNSELIRNAAKPHQLTVPRSRLLRHLAELNRLRDRWADCHKPSRKKKQSRPLITQYDKLSRWDSPFRYGK